MARSQRHYRVPGAGATDEEITLLSQRLTPGLAGYGLVIVIGLFDPIVAVIGYLIIAVFFLIPVRVPWLLHQRT